MNFLAKILADIVENFLESLFKKPKANQTPALSPAPAPAPTIGVNQIEAPTLTPHAQEVDTPPAPPAPKPTPKHEDSPKPAEEALTKIDNTIASDEFQKIEHPDTTKVPDYLKKYE